MSSLVGGGGGGLASFLPVFRYAVARDIDRGCSLWFLLFFLLEGVLVPPEGAEFPDDV